MKITEGLSLRSWHDIKILFKRIRFIFRYGYLPMAHYEGFNWFIDTMRDILTFYRDERTSDPWVLEADYAEDLEEDNHNKVTDDFNKMLEYLDKMDEKNYDYYLVAIASMKENKDKFFELFNKYFYYLWD